VNWSLILTSMLPEHLLLAGMLAILGLEIRNGRPSDGFGFAVVFVAAAAVAALQFHPPEVEALGRVLRDSRPERDRRVRVGRAVLDDAHRVAL